MVKSVFQIEVEPVNEFVTVEGLEVKLRRLAGGIGLRVLSARQVSENEPKEDQREDSNCRKGGNI